MAITEAPFRQIRFMPIEGFRKCTTGQGGEKPLIRVRGDGGHERAKTQHIEEIAADSVAHLVFTGRRVPGK